MMKMTKTSPQLSHKLKKYTIYSMNRVLRRVFGPKRDEVTG
jgi:hypothetical protein